MKSLCVFCGSSSGSDPAFIEAARLLGRTLAENQITLVYGGSNVGLMGAVADAALEHNGKVIGVLPKFLQGKEIAHNGLTELILCETMHERKTKMFERSEGFIALPGGFGTLEEVVEILTWQQLGLHKFPIAFLNVNGYYDHLRQFFNVMESQKLLKTENRNMALFGDTVIDVLDQMKSYKPINVDKWVGKTTT
jgi:uncharacterized protein (TIGR00730 family)